jgi:ElaB/YqjD/DUF883 family membrane-anchored ribosome-binding protein
MDTTGTIEAHSSWYNRTTKETNSYKDSLSPKEAKKYKLDLLLRITGRVEEFTSICGECELSREEVTRVSQDLGYLLQTPGTNKETRKRYLKSINNIVKHLQKKHNLVTEGQNKGKWTLIGMAFSTAVGAVADQPGIGIAVGAGLGIAIGSYLDKKAKDEGRVI